MLHKDPNSRAANPSLLGISDRRIPNCLKEKLYDRWKIGKARREDFAKIARELGADPGTVRGYLASFFRGPKRGTYPATATWDEINAALAIYKDNNSRKPTKQSRRLRLAENTRSHSRQKRRVYGVGTVRATITIPRDVKVAMEEFQRDNYVNWSEIAVKAFQAHMKGQRAS
jgi:hypothetical protein